MLELSEKQKAVIRTSKDDTMLTLCGGAVRSGKTYSTNLAFCIFVLTECLEHDSIIAGVTIETIMRNAGFDILETLRYLGADADLVYDYGTRFEVKFRGKTTSIWLITAGDARGIKKIQGSTLKAALLDEVVLLPEEFFDMLISRLSVTGAKAWATYNPGAPRHWFKRNVIDRIEDYDGRLFQFQLDDNPSLGEDYKDRLDSAYVGHTHQRFVLGLWAGSSGLIFPEWQTYGANCDEPGQWYGSLDWGIAGVFHLLMIKKCKRYSVVIDELRYDARDAGISLTEDEHLASVKAFIHQYTRSCILYMDPSTPTRFKSMLRNAGFSTRNADNSVIPGLVTTAGMLKRKEVFISDNCSQLQEEMFNYMWDERSSEDRPIKENDHGCDALRYYCHSTGKHLAPNGKPTRVKDMLHVNRKSA